MSVSFASGDAAAVSVPSGTLTFTSSTWGTAQTVTVQGVGDDDAGDEAVQVTVTASSTDVDYQVCLVRLMSRWMIPNGGFGVSESSLDIGEDGSGSFTVKLASRPSADVSVSFTSGDAAAVSVSSGTLTFTARRRGARPRPSRSRVSPMMMRQTRPVQVTVAVSSTDADYAGCVWFGCGRVLMIPIRRVWC